MSQLTASPQNVPSILSLTVQRPQANLEPNVPVVCHAKHSSFRHHYIWCVAGQPRSEQGHVYNAADDVS